MILEELKNKITLGDSLEILKQLPDKCIDLVLTDPPYGINANSMQLGRSGCKIPRGEKEWDSEIPNDNFFAEMIRVSKNQIIFGGNYFPILWKFAGKGFIFWDKCQPVNSFMNCFADGELAWTSFNKPAKRYKYPYYGNIDGNAKAEEKIHPTQKPLKLFETILRDYMPRVAGGGASSSRFLFG
jgi:site-specific DNA-methyltransferase (adenine-specific)